jgi:hypothetical protein
MKAANAITRYWIITNRQSAIRLRQGFGEQVGKRFAHRSLSEGGAIGNEFLAAQDQSLFLKIRERFTE